MSGAAEPVPVARRQAGFTLVEALVATTIMAVVLAALLAGFVETYRSTRSAGRSSVLSHAAAEKLEQLALLDYGHGDLGAGTHPTQAIDSSGARYYPAPGFDEDYSLRWIVSGGPTDAAGNEVAHMKTIVVEATYRVRYTEAGLPIPTPGSLHVVLQSFRSE